MYVLTSVLPTWTDEIAVLLPGLRIPRRGARQLPSPANGARHPVRRVPKTTPRDRRSRRRRAPRVPESDTRSREPQVRRRRPVPPIRRPPALHRHQSDRRIPGRAVWNAGRPLLRQRDDGPRLLRSYRPSKPGDMGIMRLAETMRLMTKGRHRQETRSDKA